MKIPLTYPSLKPSVKTELLPASSPLGVCLMNPESIRDPDSLHFFLCFFILLDLVPLLVHLGSIPEVPGAELGVRIQTLI